MYFKYDYCNRKLFVRKKVALHLKLDGIGAYIIWVVLVDCSVV